MSLKEETIPIWAKKRGKTGKRIPSGERKKGRSTGCRGSPTIRERGEKTIPSGRSLPPHGWEEEAPGPLPPLCLITAGGRKGVSCREEGKKPLPWKREGTPFPSPTRKEKEGGRQTVKRIGPLVGGGREGKVH